jgi:hypothetical protein
MCKVFALFILLTMTSVWSQGANLRFGNEFQHKYYEKSEFRHHYEFPGQNITPVTVETYIMTDSGEKRLRIQGENGFVEFKPMISDDFESEGKETKIWLPLACFDYGYKSDQLAYAKEIFGTPWVALKRRLKNKKSHRRKLKIKTFKLPLKRGEPRYGCELVMNYESLEHKGIEKIGRLHINKW